MNAVDTCGYWRDRFEYDYVYMPDIKTDLKYLEIIVERMVQSTYANGVSARVTPLGLVKSTQHSRSRSSDTETVDLIPE